MVVFGATPMLFWGVFLCFAVDGLKAKDKSQMAKEGASQSKDVCHET